MVSQGREHLDVSIIMVTYGAREMTLACLRTLAVETDALASEVIIVDNASPGALAGEIASLYPDFVVLPQAANLGFAAAANLGADFARGQYLLFLNPDTLIPTNALIRLLDAARRDGRGGLWGVRTQFAEGSQNRTFCRRIPTLWRLLCSGLGLDTRFPDSRLVSGMGYARLPRVGLCEVEVVCGVCLLVRREVWERLAGFSPAFFMYGEDDDFSLRARQLGYRPTLIADIGIVHHGSGTEADQARKLSQIFAARALLVNGYLALPARQVGRAFLLLRPLLAKHFSRRELRPVWKDVWNARRRWLAGRFALSVPSQHAECTTPG